MSGMEPMIIGAVAGAATNRDDPLRGAMMGAALGGLGGAGYSALTGASGAAGGAAAGEAALGASELGALARQGPAPVLSDYITQANTTGQMPITPALMTDLYPVSGAADLGFMNLISPSQQAAIEAGNLPSSAMFSPFGDVIGYEEAAGKELAKAQAKDAFMRGGGLQNMMSASSGLLRQAQPKAQMQSPGGIRRGQPQAVNYGGLASLLEPKLVERRRLSLL